MIHSFWVPSLNGKQDLIPGQQNLIEIIASRPGVYRGQCAEFCGLQHAHMGMLVVAETPEDFDAWRTRQRAAADPPTTDEGRDGLAVFTSRGCLMCHRVRGTIAGGAGGPDLTHVGARRMIAASELPLTRGTLAAWIANPQAIKPGSLMPQVRLGPDELNAVAAYLEGLK